MRRTQLLCMVMAMLAVPSFALADSISPISDQANLTVGQTYSITKTVTVDARSPGDAVDIVFVFDTTDGMQSFFEDANYGWTKGVLDIPTDLVGIATGKGYTNVQYGVVTYEDFPVAPWGGAGDVAYTKLADIGTGAAAIAAMQGISTGFGNDLPEANLHALGTLASDMTWRAGSTRVVIWIGDQPGHPDFQKATPAGPTYADAGGLFNTPSAIAALLANGVIVEAMDIANLDANVKNYANVTIDSGQGTAISGGTGGDYWSGFWSGALNVNRFDGLLAAVADALDAALLNYIVSLDTSGVDADLGLTGAGGSFAGSRTSAQNYVWNLQYKPTATGNYNFAIAALVDGLPVAWEEDSYQVLRGTPGDPAIPEPSTVALLGLGLLGVGVAARRRRKK